MKILIADDQTNFRTRLENDLSAIGHSVTSAENGWDALVELGSKEFDLAILDIEMPKLDGLALLRICTKSKNKIVSKTKFIILTSHSGLWNSAIAWTHNAAATISKPYDISDLTQMIEKL